MTVFVDASALIAIVAQELDALALAECLEGDPDHRSSAVAVWEAMAGLCRSHGMAVEATRARVRLFLDALGIRIVVIGEQEFGFAAGAYARFGKGRYPAALNMGGLLRLCLRPGTWGQAAVQGRGLQPNGHAGGAWTLAEFRSLK